MGRKAAPTKAKPLPVKRSSSPKLVIDAAQMAPRCFICDEMISGKAVPLILGNTRHSKTRMPTKIGQLMGDGYMVVVSQDDLLCLRCVALLNHLDKLEGDLKIVRKALIGYLKKKYHLGDDTSKQKLFPDGEIVNGEEADITGEENDAGAKEGSADESSALIADSGATAEGSGHSASEPMETDAAADHEIATGTSHASLPEERNDMGNTKNTTETDFSIAKDENDFSKAVHVLPQDGSGGVLYKCVHCNFASDSVGHIKLHIYSHNSAKTFPCSVCKKVFNCQESCQRHVTMVHSSENSLLRNCNLSVVGAGVGAKVNTPGDFVEQGEVLECNICEYRTTDRNLYGDHCRKHIFFKFFTCKLCGEEFEEKGQLHAHEKNHGSSRLFRCGVCSEIFRNSNILMNHLHSHKLSKEEKGKVSAEKTKNPSSKSHSLSSSTGDRRDVIVGSIEGSKSEEKSVDTKDSQSTADEIKNSSDSFNFEELYHCSNCLYSTTNKIHLLQHSQGHKQKKRHGCKVCGKSYGSQQSLWMHVRYHASRGPYKCSFCDKSFRISSYRDIHERNHLKLADGKSPVNNQEKIKVNKAPMSLPKVFETAANLPNTDHQFTVSESKSVRGHSEDILEISLSDAVDKNSKESSDLKKDQGKYSAGFAISGETSRNDSCSMSTEIIPLQNLDQTRHDTSGVAVLNKSLLTGLSQVHPPNIMTGKTTLKGRVYKCGICNFRSRSKMVISTHFKEHIKSYPFKCHKCSKSFLVESQLEKHVKYHEKHKYDIKCQICKKQLEDLVEYEYHMKCEHHDSHVEYPCLLCNKLFTSKRTFVMHQRYTHEGLCDLECDICGKWCSREAQLQRHKAVFHREPFCRICGKEITNLKTLNEHEQRHRRDPDPHVCQVCGRILKTRGGLRSHMVHHVGNFKMYCPHCNKGFMAKSMYDDHVATHTKEDRFTCDVCGKKFYHQSTYWIHRKWHDNPFPYKCDICGEKFRHSSRLAIHKRRHTGERPYKCPNCSQRFLTGGSLKRHLIKHTGQYPYYCPVCKRGFDGRHKLAIHLARVHNDDSMLQNQEKKVEYKVVVHRDEEALMQLINSSGADNLEEECTTSVPERIVEVQINDKEQAIATISNVIDEWCEETCTFKEEKSES